MTRDATSPLAKSQDGSSTGWAASTWPGGDECRGGHHPAPLARPDRAGHRASIEQAACSPAASAPGDVLADREDHHRPCRPRGHWCTQAAADQNMHATLNAARLRTELLDFTDQLNEARGILLDTAGKHLETFVPAYTNGVQAMPISYGHYLLAFADSFGRDAERVRQAPGEPQRAGHRRAGQLQLAAQPPAAGGGAARLRRAGRQRTGCQPDRHLRCAHRSRQHRRVHGHPASAPSCRTCMCGTTRSALAAAGAGQDLHQQRDAAEGQPGRDPEHPRQGLRCAGRGRSR